jgi:predicted outer membrane repeat protein
VLRIQEESIFENNTSLQEGGAIFTLTTNLTIFGPIGNGKLIFKSNKA